MFTTADYYLGSEVAYRHERATRDWKVVNGRRRVRGGNRGQGRRQPKLRLPAQPHLSLPEQGRGGAVVA